MSALTFSSAAASCGCSLAKVRISQRATPNDHTSLLLVYTSCQAGRMKNKTIVIRVVDNRAKTYQEEGLPCHPSERDKLAAGSKRGVVGGIERSRHPTLADLHSMAREHEHISDGKVKLL